MYCSSCGIDTVDGLKYCKRCGVTLAAASDTASPKNSPHVPIGLDNQSSLQVVVNNRNGEVAIEDWETGRFEKIADSLDDLLARLVV